MIKIGTIFKKLIKRFQSEKVRGISWLQNHRNSHLYKHISEETLLSSKKSNTVFIFGSGYSINDISQDEWKYFEKHDTISFNWFVYQKFVRIDYHIIKEIAPNDLDSSIWHPKFNEYSKNIAENPFYSKTIFIVQKGWKATGGNRMIGLHLLSKNSNIFRYYISYRGKDRLPTFTFSEGLSHNGTLSLCINFAWIMGWKKIVLVGVDLYDRRYFWLNQKETRDRDMMRGASYKDQHNMSKVTVPLMNKWRKFFIKNNVELYVYNSKSLLAEVLPVYLMK